MPPLPGLERGLAEMVRIIRPGKTVLVAAFGPPRGAEFIVWTPGALRAAVPGLAGMPADPPHPPFRLAGPDRFSVVLREAGLVEESVHRTVANTFFASAAELPETVRGGHPLGARWIAGLTGSRAVDVRRILEGMLRERSAARRARCCTPRSAFGTGMPPAPRRCARP
ncbi:hypothetical protein [Streptomyces sp. SS8]